MDDDTLDSIDVSEFWLHDTALDADSMPVESMDFGLLTGDVVPRDGLQRPLLTSGSPTHAPVPRRASKQPINVTHVHQTVVQNFGPVAAACTLGSGRSGTVICPRTRIWVVAKNQFLSPVTPTTSFHGTKWPDRKCSLQQRPRTTQRQVWRSQDLPQRRPTSGAFRDYQIRPNYARSGRELARNNLQVWREASLDIDLLDSGLIVLPQT